MYISGPTLRRFRVLYSTMTLKVTRGPIHLVLRCTILIIIWFIIRKFVIVLVGRWRWRLRPANEPLHQPLAYILKAIPTWISNCINYKVWGEMTYPFPNFNEYVLSSHTSLGMWRLIHVVKGTSAVEWKVNWQNVPDKHLRSSILPDMFA